MSSEPQELPEGTEEGSSGFQILTGGVGPERSSGQGGQTDVLTTIPGPGRRSAWLAEHQLFVSLEQTFNK